MYNFIKYLALIHVIGATSTCDPSSYPIVTSCYRSFFSFYNLSISSSMEFPKYLDYLNAVVNYEKLGSIEEFKKVCTIQNSLTSCLGDSVSCINSKDLLKIFKFHDYDNEEYTGDYYMSNYKCTTAYQFMLNNFHCLITVHTLGKDKLANCKNNFIKSVPSRGCQAANIFISCLGEVFGSYCGPKGEDLACNIAKIDMTYDMPQCKDKLKTCNQL
uniref:DUF19 domain-containing protein n=1 Tax=Strongyloides stercoralis TaxID=6248 RepID=A0A0K0EJE4_STRER